mgnify:CR=1 FL=1
MYTPKLTRREAIAVGVGGIAGFLLGRYLPNSEGQIPDFIKFRSYAMQLLEEDFRKSTEHLQHVKGRKLRRGEGGDVGGYHWIELAVKDIDGRRVAVRVGADVSDIGWEFDYQDIQYARIGRNKQDLVMDILTPGNLKSKYDPNKPAELAIELLGRDDLVSHISYDDSGFKGNLLGPNDGVSIIKRDPRKIGWEEFSSGGNGRYWLTHLTRTEDGIDCKGGRASFDETLCIDGRLRGEGYHFHKGLPPEEGHNAIGVYRGMTRSDAQQMSERERGIANTNYKRILSRIVQDLAREGKLTENLTRQR